MSDSESDDNTLYTPEAPPPAVEVPPPKAKRPVSEKTLANLAKGREIRDDKRQERKRTREEELNLKKSAQDAEHQLREEKKRALAKLVDETVEERLKLKEAVKRVEKTNKAVSKRKKEEVSDSSSESDGESIQQKKKPAAAAAKPIVAIKPPLPKIRLI
jgi:hypothetical protein